MVKSAGAGIVMMPPHTTKMGMKAKSTGMGTFPGMPETVIKIVETDLYDAGSRH